MTILANFALKYIQADPALLYECGFFRAGSIELLDAAYKKTLVDLRPEMIGVVELLPDGAQPTTIGNEYGDIYENQYETAKASALNPKNGEVPELYHSHMKPVMKLGAAVAKL